MILDSGICTVFRAQDISEPGAKPVTSYEPIWQSWYGELDYETAPAWITEGRKEQRVDNRIRIYQCREIRQNDVVVLEALSDFGQRSEASVVYKVVRAWHGADNAGPSPISDLSLEVSQP